MSRGKYINLEETRKADQIDQVHQGKLPKAFNCVRVHGRTRIRSSYALRET